MELTTKNAYRFVGKQILGADNSPLRVWKNKTGDYIITDCRGIEMILTDNDMIMFEMAIDDKATKSDEIKTSDKPRDNSERRTYDIP